MRVYSLSNFHFSSNSSLPRLDHDSDSDFGPIAMKTQRFPFSSFPSGWFQVAYSDELVAGQVLPLSYLGKNLVLFRTDDGKPCVLDAFCPHLGAHLGYGGKVDRGAIRCPFHGWRISGEGKVVAVPYSEIVPAKAKIAAWPVRETNGMILLHHASDGERPSWEVPELPEFHSEAWGPYVKKRWKVRTHIQEILENIVDPAHFRSVHRMMEWPRTEVETEGSVLRSRSKTKMRTPRGDVDAEITWEAHGMGLGWIRFTGIVETLFVNAVTPIDQEYVDLRFSFLQKKEDPAGVRAALIDEICGQVDEDVPIWENKIYREKPMLTRGEATVMILRRWCRQFLTDS